MRNTFFRTLESIAKSDPKLFLLVGDMGFSSCETFQERFQEQFINTGPSEQNMIGVAAGLAMHGKRVFIYSVIPFITLRVLEQIKLDICHHNLAVTLVGAGAGFAYGSQGPTHHGIDDLPAMLSLPGMHVFSPADPRETAFLVKASYKLRKPCYIRIVRNKDPVLTALRPPELFKARSIKRGKHFSLITTGNALGIAKRLDMAGKRFSILHLHSLKPIDKEAICAEARRTGHVFSIEEHSSEGGLGHLVAKIISEQGVTHSLTGKPVVFKALAVDLSLCKQPYGSVDYLRDMSGLSTQAISQIIQKETVK